MSDNKQTGFVKWFDAKKDLVLLVLKSMMTFLCIFLISIWKDLKF